MLDIGRWLRKRFELAQPAQAPIEIREFVSSGGIPLVFEPLSPPPQGVPELLQEHGSLLITLHLEYPYQGDYHVTLAAPEQSDLALAEFDLPQTIDLFDPLRLPGRAGKAYGPKGGAPEPEPTTPTTRAQARCRHGMLAGMCSLCQRERVPTRKAVDTQRLTSVDVFDLVLPYLYPPIDLDRPLAVVFPPNKRPYPFQYEGIKFLIQRKAALLGDEMGLGKTIQSIVALRILARQGEVRRALILCPRSMLGTWEKELLEWAPELSLQRVRGTAHERDVLWGSAAHILLTTYETLRNDISRLAGASKSFDLLLLDEAQRIKNPAAGVSRACGRLVATYRWGMSATPLENKEEDVIAIFQCLKPDLFGPATRYATASGIRETIRPYFLRRRTADVLSELPPKISEEVWLELTDEQRKTYNNTLSQRINTLRAPGATRIHVFSLISELKQICNLDPASGKSCKLELLRDMLADVLLSQKKALVFSHYPEKTLEKIMPSLTEFSPVLFSGKLSDVEREKVLARFRSNGPPHVMLLSVQAGGTGLTLTEANHVFHYDHWWNPAVTNQATGRAHRIGQQHPVMVYHLYTRDTIEERVYELLSQKQRLFSAVIDDLSEQEFLRSVSDEELFGLFGLKPPASNVPSTQQRPLGAQYTTREALDGLTPREFEKVVARWLEKNGYAVKLTEYSRDGGVDLIARKVDVVGIEDCMVVQCKHTPNAVIGAPVVQQLIGASVSYPDATHRALVTSGRFSSEAAALAAKQQVLLVDGQRLREELIKAALL